MASSPSRSEEPVRTKETLFSGIVLTLGAGGALAIALLAGLGGTGTVVSPQRRILFMGGALLLSAALAASLRLGKDARTAISVTLLSLVVAAYIGEFYVRWTTTHQFWSLGRSLGLSLDDRPRAEVVRDLRREGKNAWPVVHPNLFLDRGESLGLIPLAGVSNATTVLCNEVGPHVVYRSDEHGFRNPPGAWSAADLQLAAIGDSFTLGMCVEDDQSAMALLRRVYPRTLNLGMSGDGPLLELATLKEFLPELKPSRVLWMYFEGNDLTPNLDEERKSPMLQRYLQEGTSQNLVRRQEEVDAALRGWLTQQYEHEARGNFPKHLPPGFWRDFLMLRTFRKSLNLLLPANLPQAHPIDPSLFRRVLEEAERTVSEWDGQLILVYLPWQTRFSDQGARAELDQAREKVLSVVRELQIPLIDVEPAVEKKGGATLYVRRPGGHFTPQGYRVVADTILAALQPRAE